MHVLAHVRDNSLKTNGGGFEFGKSSNTSKPKKGTKVLVQNKEKSNVGMGTGKCV